MTAAPPNPGPSGDGTTLDPPLEAEVTPDLLDDPSDARVDGREEPTPGSDNDGAESGYTPPAQTPDRAVQEPPD